MIWMQNTYVYIQNIDGDNAKNQKQNKKTKKSDNF